MTDQIIINQNGVETANNLQDDDTIVSQNGIEIGSNLQTDYLHVYHRVTEAASYLQYDQVMAVGLGIEVGYVLKLGEILTHNVAFSLNSDIGGIYVNGGG